MLVWMFLLLFGFGLFCIVLSLKNENNAFWNIVPIVLAIVVFFILSLSVHEIVEPYQLYNGTSIETGLHKIHLVENSYISYIFSGIAILLLIYLVAMIYDKHMTFKQ